MHFSRRGLFQLEKGVNLGRVGGVYFNWREEGCIWVGVGGVYFNLRRRRGCISAGGGASSRSGASLVPRPGIFNTSRRGGVIANSLVIIHFHIMHPGTRTRMGMNSSY